MDPHQPFDHPHHRRAHPGHHHYLDQHHLHHLPAGGGGGGGGVAPARSRYEYDSHPIPHRMHKQKPYHGGDDFRPADEIRRAPSHHPPHPHHLQPQHHYQQPPLSREEVEEERWRYPAHQLRVSPPGARKRYRCAMHDSGDLESTSSSGPPPRRQRQQLHPSYSPPPEGSFVDREISYSGYSSHEGFVTHSDSNNGNRKMPMSTSAMLPGSPNSLGAGYPRRAPQTAPARVSVWQRIEENPSVYTPPSPRKVHISPSKMKNPGSAPKELASVISLDCKSKSADSKDNGDSAGMKKNVVKTSEKVLASVLVKPSSEAKEKERAVSKVTKKSDSKVTKKPDKVENNIPGFTSGGVRSAAFPGAGGKKVKKIVIKKIVRKICTKDKQTSPIVSEKKDGIDANANASEKEEGEITSSSFEKDAISAHNLVSTSDTAGVANSVEVQREQSNDLVNLGKSNASPTIASTGALGTASVSRREHPGKEDDRSFMNSVDGNASPAIESTKTFNTTREHPGRQEDGVSIDSSGINAAFPCETNNSQKEEGGEILAVSGALNVASNSPRMLDAVRTHESEVENIEDKVPEVLSGNNASYVHGGKDDTAEVSENGNGRREEGDFFVNDSIRRPMTAEVSMTMSKDDNEKEGMILMGSSEVCVASLENSEGPFKIAEATATAHKEEGMLKNPREKYMLSVSSCGALNTPEISVNENKEKECRIPIEPSETVASFTHQVKASNTLEVSVIESVQKESQVPIYSSSSEKIQCPEAPNTAEVAISKFVQSEAGKRSMDLSGKYVGTSDNSVCAPEYLLHDAKPALSKSDFSREVVNTYLQASRDIESTNLSSLDDDPMKDSSGAVNLDNGIGRNTVSQVAELTHLHRTHPSPDNNFSFLHSHDSPSVSGNSEHSVPTALTLGNNIYFSRTESEGQPEENHKLMEVNQGFDVVTKTEFGSISNRKGESGNDLINAGVQNWLTLPLTVSYVNNDVTGSTDRLDLDQIMDEGASICQDHDIMPDMEQRGSIDALSGQDDSLNLCGNNTPQSDLLATKERNKDIDDETEAILPGGELASSQVYVDPDHTYHSNTEDHVAVPSTKPDPLSSWIEAIVSEAKKEHQSCKSTQHSISSSDKLLAPKEDSRKAVSDSVVNSVVKSPPRINIASSTVSKVPAKQVALPSSSREPPRLNQNARHRTWRRDNVSSSISSLHVSQPSGLPPKLPIKKNGQSQNSYIRKGNALIRNPATGNHPHSSNLDAQNKLSKPVMRRSLNFVRKVDSNDAAAHSNLSVERPKTPPLPLHTKSISCAVNLLEPLSQTLQNQQLLETEKEDSNGQVISGVDNPLHRSEPLDAGKAVYVRPKLNQLVASQGQHPGDSSNSSMDKLMQPSATSDLYFKKRKNQIVLGSSTSDVSSTKDMTQAENIKSALKTTNTVGSFSHVWTLSGQHPRRKSFVGTSHMKVFPRILPWKRKMFCQNFRSSYPSLLNTSSLGIVRKLLQTRKRSTIYTVSTDGFSLRKSGVLSIGGSSLKWSRSLEKHSQKVNEEATLAVAEVERKKREKRNRQSIRNKGRNDQYSATVAANQLRNSNRASSDSRVPSTCNEYVRVNKGNQLVRNPKKVIRMLASEKVRWSLHTVRTRLAKKQQYCQFFTRFGECKKSGGKCPYIHDRAKVAICTKFLKGLCSNTSCKLTHKVLPERMPDCSYFLRGLCTNTACPYRHVKVNSKAPVCEDFLKGYCADGDECRKKHSYVCPVFEATGECPQESRCKLHHPKKKIKSKRSRVDTLQTNSWGRYFDTSIGHRRGARVVSSEEEERQKREQVSGDDLADFIDLGADIEVTGDVDTSDDIQLMELDSRNLKMRADNLEALIKPLRIMRTARV
ncbi:hypothetical protein SETIT_4G205600v2 [Setaria italica]|uniref:C3H1-type domain-containing protein n=1 Tax=Setaria italica TaxID=4555 RepID=A0A368QWS8_SETIT|nr:hypothetical protein SETIT_4G205600v2 [Setaria italica]